MTQLGAYGLRLPQLPGPQWLTEAPTHWPEWSLTLDERQPTDDEARFFLDDDLCRIPALDGELILVHRLRRESTFVAPRPPRSEAWVHPILSPVAIVAAEWSGRLVFHAGSFLDRAGRVWVLLGDRGRGKSTSLAWLASRGHPVFADDLLVTDGTTAYAGPRCIDLRESAARTFGIGRPLGIVGARDRWRVDLPQVAAEAPLGGFITLSWTETETDPVSVELVQDQQRGGYLAAARALLERQQHALAWLKVLATPMIAFDRPRSWAAQSDALEELLCVIGA